MKKQMRFFLFVGFGIALATVVKAQNPFIKNQFTADPTARVFGNRVYVYPSHDIIPPAGVGRPGWFNMEDYHVFSSENLTDWTDHGVIVTQNNVPWVRPGSYSMWAPDCIERNGKFYFYFPSIPKDTSEGRGFRIGVAVADNPAGPFVPQPEPMKGVRGIDPNVFIDKDGQAYLYWSQGAIYGAKLKENMLELASEVKTLEGLPTDKGLKEGPYVFERNGKYYMTYPHVANKTERLEYAVSDSPLGPFQVTGVIMDETPGCWTNHHSILQYKDQWYLFYHANDYSPAFDKARSIRADSLFFHADGSIQKVRPTLRGIGITPANSKIEIDRYSDKSNGAGVDFLDTTNRFLGWKARFNGAGDWLQYNTVDFGAKKLKTVRARVSSEKGGSLQFRSHTLTGTVLATVIIPPSREWKEITVPVSGWQPGVKHLVVSAGNSPIELDWVQFE